MKECSLRDGSSMIWSLCACVGGRGGGESWLCVSPALQNIKCFYCQGLVT